MRKGNLHPKLIGHNANNDALRNSAQFNVSVFFVIVDAVSTYQESA
jgi:hypothetical protein